MNPDLKVLSKRAQSIQDILLEKGRAFDVVELATSTRTSKEAALTIGCDVAQIVKSLLFRTVVSHQPVLILVSGVNRVNEILIEACIEEKIVKADADFTRDKTGFAIGGVSPIGHINPIQTIFIDEDLLQFEKIWAAAGTPHAVFCLSPHDLVSLTGGKIITLK